jgi:hypothetical protein
VRITRTRAEAGRLRGQFYVYTDRWRRHPAFLRKANRLDLFFTYVATRTAFALALGSLRLLPPEHPYRIFMDSHLRDLTDRLAALPRWGIVPCEPYGPPSRKR